MIPTHWIPSVIPPPYSAERKNYPVNTWNYFPTISTYVITIHQRYRWLGGVAVGRWTRDQEVAGWTPTAALFGQQPWASCSHLMCLCSPSSITWYLARAFTLKAPHCWQRNRVQWTREYCRAVLRWFTNCTEPRYKSSALPLPFTDGQTDARTDGQTTYDSHTVLWVSRGKNSRYWKRLVFLIGFTLMIGYLSAILAGSIKISLKL